MIAIALFDQSAITYDHWCETEVGSFVDQVEKELMKEVAKPQKGEKALDLGCGTGIYSYWLYEQGLDVVGIDISKNMLDVAKKKKDAKNITFLQGDISNLPFANETFDLVISNIVLEFTHNPQVIVKEALRVVKKGGRLVIGFIGKESTWGKMYHKKGKNDPTSVFAHAKFFNTDEIAQLNETPPIQFNYGLYVAMDEFTTIEAARELEKDRTKTSSDQDAGYIVAKWQKI